jgi:3-phosphoshikimate 1-carboxyvinyltransferase
MVTDPVYIPPVNGPVHAEPCLPGSKSITSRALVLAALADGVSTIEGALFSDDTNYMASALQALGFEVAKDPSRRVIQVRGHGGRIPADHADLYVGNAGTAARFLTAMVALGRGSYRIDGNDRMRARPIEPLLAALRALGVDAVSERGTGCPPVVVQTRGLAGGHAELASSASSQYLSALLMAAPSAQSPVTIAITGAVVSEPYIAMTAAIMEQWGLTVASDLTVPAPQIRSPRTYRVEPDASAASYFLALAALTGGTTRVCGLRPDSLQGDIGFVGVLEAMGCAVEWLHDALLLKGPPVLHGVDVDMNAISDTVMTLAAIAPFADSPTTIRNVAHIRHKECDRIQAIVTELGRLGITVAERPDGMIICPSQPKSGLVQTYDDHRMAMSFALIGLRVPGIGIANPGCVAKTFPGYFEELMRITGGS